MTRLAHGYVPSRLPRPGLALLSAFTLAVLAPSRSEARPMPRYGELPVGRMTAPPTAARPASIPAGESVAGLTLTPGTSGQLVVSVDGTPARRSATASTRSSTSAPPRPGDACFSYDRPPVISASLDRFAGRPGSDDLAQEWDTTLAPDAFAWGPPHGAGVVAIHVERVTERDGAPALETMDAWVDPTTRAGRLIAKAVLPLREVASAPGGVKILAGRDERPDGKSFVQLVLTRTKDAPQVGSPMSTREDGSLVPLGNCAHQRVALAATKSGESAVVQLPTVLSPLAPGEPSVTPPRSRLASGNQASEVRTRPLRINMSVSQTSRDKEPILAVSTAWGGPESHQPVFGPLPSPPPPTIATVAPLVEVAKPRSADPGF